VWNILSADDGEFELILAMPSTSGTCLTDPAKLASLADPRIKAALAKLAEALTGASQTIIASCCGYTSRRMTR
jgi:hypothetical protein